MLEHAQGILSKSMSVFTSSGATVKSLAGAHPVALGVLVGFSAYYAVNKYWLNKDIDETDEVAEEEELEESATTV
jgi:hypothetical protein